MKMWDGRFSKASSTLLEKINNSLPIDQAMIEEDIQGSIAWARALQRVGVLSDAELKSITGGLEDILQRYQAGEIEFASSDEDIHMAVERLLTERIGEAGAKLHTGRSRNDQVATDFRLFVMRRLDELAAAVFNLQQVLFERAQKDRDIIIPGYTHLQQAQPVSMAHYWLSFFFLLEREKARIASARMSADHLPLGAGALAGSGFAVDREKLAADLGFSRTTDNSMDSVAARDFALEALSACASIGIGCSRYAEDLIIWSSREFGFVELDDAWSTGSSMMPQKKNPDSLELVRGKAGRLIGNYTRLATTLKGVGLTYYKDLQEDKEPFIDSTVNLMLVLMVFAEVVETLSVKRERIAGALDPFLLATDLADYLVRKGMAFREAHRVVGRIVGFCAEKEIALDTMTVEQLTGYSELFEEDVLSLFNWDTALAGRDVQGGTGPGSVDGQLKKAQEIVDD